jgi:hypothetical protein
MISAGAGSSRNPPLSQQPPWWPSQCASLDWQRSRSLYPSRMLRRCGSLSSAYEGVAWITSKASRASTIASSPPSAIAMRMSSVRPRRPNTGLSGEPLRRRARRGKRARCWAVQLVTTGMPGKPLAVATFGHGSYGDGEDKRCTASAQTGASATIGGSKEKRSDDEPCIAPLAAGQMKGSNPMDFVRNCFGVSDRSRFHSSTFARRSIRQTRKRSRWKIPHDNSSVEGYSM